MQFAIIFFLLLAATSLAERPVYNCESWLLSVEANNARNWNVVPENCIDTVKDYMEGNGGEAEYELTCKVVVEESVEYINQLLPLAPNDTWLFDLTNTLVSDLEYYRGPDGNYGGNPFDKVKYNNWLINPNSSMPVVPHISDLYYAAQQKGFKIVILSSNDVSSNTILTDRLTQAGFSGWDRLILRPGNILPSEFKEKMRAQLLKEGYKVVGNVGDQWSDLLGGDNVGLVTYKLPNPMYYVK